MRARLAAAAAALALLVLVPAAPASAHAYLTGSTPAAGSTVTAAPAGVTLEFDEALVDLGSDSVTVVGPGGRHFETGCAVVDGTAVRVAVALGAAGTYTVAYRVVSDDGHVVEDAYTFRFAGTGAATGSASGPSCAAAPAVAPVTSGGPPVVVIVAIAISGAVLLGVLILIVVVVVRTRRAP